MRGTVSKGGFDWLQTHEQADSLLKDLMSDLENGRAVAGYMIQWVIAQNPS